MTMHLKVVGIKYALLANKDTHILGLELLFET
jgi:hypothetical protein